MIDILLCMMDMYILMLCIKFGLWFENGYCLVLIYGYGYWFEWVG